MAPDSMLNRTLDLTKGDSLLVVLEQLPEGVLIFDRFLHIVYFNQTAEVITGYLSDEAVGAFYPQIFRVDEKHCALTRAIQCNENYMVSDETLETKRGKRLTVELSISLLYDEERAVAGGIAVFRDVTRIREIEEMKNEFVSIVSHELRTPLASIGGYCDLLLIGATGELNDDQRNYLKTIQRNSDNLSRLINDLLDLSKIESKKMEVSMSMVNVLSLIKEVADDLQPLVVQKGLSIKIECPEILPNLYCDVSKTKQILTNLVGNAIKFTGEGGNITLGVKEEPRNMTFIVQDTGIGIPRNKLEAIFDKFQQLENPLTREKDGTGLGLAISKALVERQNGRIWVESEEGVGSRFFFSLPLKRGHWVSETMATGGLDFLRCWHHLKCHKVDCVQYESDDPKCWAVIHDNLCFSSEDPLEERLKRCAECDVYKSNMRILQDTRGLVLVLDDDVDQVNLVAGYLEREGYSCVRSHVASHALDLARMMKPHVVISDTEMPTMDGYAFVNLMKGFEETKDIPVIFLRERDGGERSRRRRSYSSVDSIMVMDSLEKPVDRLHLLAHVENILVKRRGKKERRRRGRKLILVLDRWSDMFNLVRLYLDERRYEAVHARGGVDTIELSKQIYPDLIVMNTNKPGSDDYSVIGLIMTEEETKHIPVILMANTDDREKALKSGVTEFIIKPLRQREFLGVIGSICSRSLVESEKKILVLDPDTDARTLVAASLSRHGYDVESLNNGSDALEWISEQEPDLVIMDVNTPGLDGFDIAQRMREDKNLSQTPVMVFTSRDLSNEERQMLKVGTTMYEMKTDFTEERLLKQVRELL